MNFNEQFLDNLTVSARFNVKSVEEAFQRSVICRIDIENTYRTRDGMEPIEPPDFIFDEEALSEYIWGAKLYGEVWETHCSNLLAQATT